MSLSCPSTWGACTGTCHSTPMSQYMGWGGMYCDMGDMNKAQYVGVMYCDMSQYIGMIWSCTMVEVSTWPMLKVSHHSCKSKFSHV